MTTPTALAERNDHPHPDEQSAGRGRWWRPQLLRSVGAAVLATVVLSIGSNLGGVHAPELSTTMTVIGLAVVFVVLGVIATRAVASQVATAAAPAGLGTASAAKLLCQLSGYLVVVLGAFGILTIPLQQLLIGGALTGVVLGIAAQQSLANLFAGLVLLVTRHVTGRQRVCVRSGALGGPLEGHVVEMGLMYTVLDTDGETVHIPNSALLGAAISTRPASGTSGAADATRHQTRTCHPPALSHLAGVRHRPTSTCSTATPPAEGASGTCFVIWTRRLAAEPEGLVAPAEIHDRGLVGGSRRARAARHRLNGSRIATVAGSTHHAAIPAVAIP